MTKIYIARHGQDEDNANGLLNGRRDTPLTALGIEQAQALAKKIKELDLAFNAVYSSPLQRAYTTAEIVATSLGIVPPKKVELLIERELGVMTGTPIRDIERTCTPHILKSEAIVGHGHVVYFLAAEGAETFPQLLERARGALRLIEKDSAGLDVLLVAHGDIGKMLYAAFYELDWEEVLTTFHFGNSDILLLEKGSRPEERHIHKTTQYNH